MRRWFILGVVLACFGAGAGYLGLTLLTVAGPLPESADVVVPRGGLDMVGETLQRAGVVGNARLFRVFAALTVWQGRLRAAELHFPAQASLAQVFLVLRTGRPVQHKLTIPEGLTAARIAMVLARADGLDGDITVPREASFLPETYLYERGNAVGHLIQRGQAAMQLAIDRAWAGRAPDLGLASRQDMVIMASLVERETHLPAERAMVARVFYNRLAHGMRLQSDPTTMYGASGGLGELSAGLSKTELEQATPYNTYVVTGLPAGPICSPGIASINAAAHPARTQALYFVADGTGGHAFSDSLDEHLRNVRRYHELGR